MEQFYSYVARNFDIINHNFNAAHNDMERAFKAIKKQRGFNTKTTILLVVGGLCIYGIVEQCKELTKKVNNLEQEVTKLKYPEAFKED